MKGKLALVLAGFGALGFSGIFGILLVPFVVVIFAVVLVTPSIAAAASCRQQDETVQVTTYGFALATGEERTVATAIIAAAEADNLDGYAAASALVGSMTTTGLRNLPSTGIFDVDKSWSADRADVDKAIAAYFGKLEALKPDYHSYAISDLAALVLGQPAGANFQQNEDAAWSWLVKTKYPLPAGYAMPIDVDQVQVQRGFRYEVNPATGALNQHHGVDLSAAQNTPILAFADGKVVYTGPAGDLGNVVIIEHPQLGVATLYGHIFPNELFVKAGDQVKEGDKIAGVGMAGAATGFHLHFEIRQSANSALAQVSPYDWLFSGGTVRAIGHDGKCAETGGSTPDPGVDSGAIAPLGDRNRSWGSA